MKAYGLKPYGPNSKGKFSGEYCKVNKKIERRKSKEDINSSRCDNSIIYK